MDLETVFDVLKFLLGISIGSLLRTKDSENEMIIDEASTPPFIQSVFYPEYVDIKGEAHTRACLLSNLNFCLSATPAALQPSFVYFCNLYLTAVSKGALRTNFLIRQHIRYCAEK